MQKEGHRGLDFFFKESELNNIDHILLERKAIFSIPDVALKTNKKLTMNLVTYTLLANVLSFICV